MAEVNVESIMEEIRAKIKEEGLDASKLSFEDIFMQSEELGTDIGDYRKEELISSCTYMNNHYEVSVWHPINSVQPVLGSFITFGKKVMRKLTRFFIQPIVEDQDHFNMHATRSMNQVRNYLIQKDKLLEESDKLIDEMLVKQAELNDRLSKLEKENEELRNRQR